MGYLQTRTRARVPMSQRSNTLCVMVKRLAGGSIQEYLSLVPRDRQVTGKKWLGKCMDVCDSTGAGLNPDPEFRSC